jgi:hypothetical protein
MRRLRNLEDDIHPSYSRSPIAKALVEARNKGFRVNTPLPRVIVALTDGDDNQTARDVGQGALIQKPAQNAAFVKGYLQDHFAGKGIELRMVCFLDARQRPENAEEFKRAQDQFGMLQDLRPRGKFLLVATEDQLLAALNEAVRPRLYLPRPSGPSIEIPGSFAGEAVAWQQVPPAQYDPYVRERQLEESLRVRKGDTMLLKVVRGGRRGLQRVVLADALPPAHKKVESGWTVGMRSNLWDPIGGDGKGRKLQQIITFERAPHRDDKVIRQDRPAFLWIETKPVGGPAPRRTIWQPVYDRSAPAYQVNVYPWEAQSGAELEAVLAQTDLWWADFPPEDNELTDWLPIQIDRPWQEKITPVGGSRVRIETISRARLPIPTEKNGAPKDCIKVRLSSVGDKAKCFLVEMNSPLIAADEHQYFLKHGIVTAAFWPSEQMKILEFRILAVDAIRARSSHVQFDRLNGKIQHRLLGEN